MQPVTSDPRIELYLYMIPSSATGLPPSPTTDRCEESGVGKRLYHSLRDQPHTVAATFVRDYPAPVYRFYNTATNTHFYTILEQEKETCHPEHAELHFEGP